MNVLFDIDKLVELISDMQSIAHIRTNIFDVTGKDMELCEGHTEFCRLINSTPEGHSRCLECDANAARICKETHQLYFYRCHVGICEAMLPIFDDDILVAYIVFGQFLDISSKDLQWMNTVSSLSWYKGDKNRLKNAFYKLSSNSKEDSFSYAKILQILGKYVQQEGYIRAAEYSDTQKLEQYINAYYKEPLSLNKVAHDLNIGTTKLCAIAKELSGGVHL